ncbi:SusC/RagA family TonB-linked outer membrane protein [Parabacteroides hominis]|uniref:TonB-dependent receptor n=1 Tax=Parabacteroides hominis TaxID=2763057 RepID=A0ABR7DKZ0_9BACT|nr:TonB-dependent receptor [Parabacteroides hominis]MBC5632032.1 TonB-dependent receptor [Parabacteroides hominis]
MKNFSLKTHSKRSGVISNLFRMLTLSLFVLCTTVVFAQQKPIKGTVVDATGEPLIGVNVSVKGTTIGIITDIDGKYTLEVPTNATLVFSYIGYRTQELPVGNQTTINITMQEDTQNIDEVVVVGYGVQKKETVTGSVSTLKGDDLVKSPVANLSNAIAGKMSGVVTYQRSGEPGYDGATIRIRGSNTLGNNDPLIVIDGVAARAGGLERLDPNEIETMSVLKDASAAIYGARAANGVILITTKKGRQGKKPEFTYSFNQGWSKPTNLPEMCDAVQYSELVNELYMNKAMLNPAKNNGQTMGDYTLFRTPEEIELYRNGSDPWRYPNTDWYAATFKNWSPQRVHNASLEGGSDKYQYFVNFGHKFTDGLYHKSANNYKQFNLRMNVDAQFNDYIKVGAQLMGRQENRNFPSQGAGDLLWFTSRGRPTDHAYWPNGLPGPAQEYGRNPVVACTDETGYTHDKRYYIQSNAKVEITQPWIEGLKLTASVSYDKYLKQSKTWFQPWTLYDWDGVSYDADGKTPKLTPMLSYPSHEDPDLSMESTDQTNTVLSGILTYDRNFGDHGVNFLVGMERDWSNAESFNAYRRYFLSNALHHFNAGGDKEKNAKSDGANWERARMNYFGRMAYNYKEKYLAEFVWRYDGSYMFAEGNRFGFFPGVLLGYRISEEDFWKENLSFIDYFKVRASWGQMGNDQVYFDGSLREYQFSPTYYYEWGMIIDNKDEKGLRISRFPNPNITWERANNFNVGIETRTFDNRLYLEADYFYNKRSNILWRRNASIPSTSGLTLPAENIGKVDNTGFDFKVEWSDNIGKDWRYSISATGGYAKNTIKFWDEAPGSPEWQKSTGHPMNTGLYYEYDGVFKDWDEINNTANRPNYDGITKDADLRPGDMKFKDLDGDGKITPDDRYRSDRTNEPKWTYGITGNLQWKNFDLSVLFQGAADSWTKVYWEAGDIGNYPKYVYDKHWSIENPSSLYPRVNERSAYYWDGTAAGNNTYWMVNTNYIRLKNLELGWTLPKAWLAQTKLISYARIYVNGVNLLTFSPCKDIDPESTSSNATNYPQSKIINVGFTVTF